MTLRWLSATTLPVEADGLTPEGLSGRTAAEVARLPLPVGNRDAAVGDLFAVGDADTSTLTFDGDVSCVRGIGRGLAGGSIVVRGRAGALLGAGMSGGSIVVEGDAGDWAGAEAVGGLLRIRGDAGDHLGSALPGGRLGMRGGVILVDGSAGVDAGRRMRRGLIAVGGRSGAGFGRDLIAGSVFGFGSVGRYAGLGMKRGTVAALGEISPAVGPSFAAAGRFRLPFLTVYLNRLAAWGFAVPAGVSGAEVGRYNGDLAVGGRGEVLVLGDLT